MKKLTAFQIILLASFGAFAVAGVLIFAIATNSSKGSAVGAVVIWGTLDGSTFSTQLQAMAQGNTDLSQVSYIHKDPATYEADITKALASGSGPDLFLMTQDEVMSEAGEVGIIPFTSFSQSQFQTLFIEAAMPYIAPVSLTRAGVIAVPLLADPLVLYWNKDMFASAGVAQPPQYWDQLDTLTSTLTTKSDGGDIQKSAIDFGEYQNTDHAKDILIALSMQAGGSITAYERGGRLISNIVPRTSTVAIEPPMLTALRFYTGFADPSSSLYTWNRSRPRGQQAFADGDLAMYVGRASEVRTIQAKNPNLNFAVAPLPQIRKGIKAVDIARVYALAIARTSHNSGGALTVAYDLANKVNSGALASVFSMASPRRDTISDAAQGNQDIFNKAAIMSYSWVDPNPTATDRLFQSMIEDTTSGALLVTEAVSRADSQMTQIIGN